MTNISLTTKVKKESCCATDEHDEPKKVHLDDNDHNHEEHSDDRGGQAHRQQCRDHGTNHGRI